MPKYYFDLIINGERDRDTKGIELDDDKAAYQLARSDLVEILRDAQANNADLAQSALVVLDEDRNILFNFPLVLHRKN